MKRRKKKKIIIRVSMLVIILALIVFGVYAIFNFINNKGMPKSTVKASTNIENKLKDNYELKEFGKSDIFKGTLILVNSNNMCNNEGDINLVNVFENKTEHALAKDRNVQVGDITLNSLNSMINEFYKQNQIGNIVFQSGYRSKEDQERVYNNSVKRYGEDHTKKYVSNPGYSEHQTGLAMDLGVFKGNGKVDEFDGSGKYGWVEKNIHKYGLIIRYPEDKTAITKIEEEPWHLRYVGIPHSYIIYNNKMCLEEYIDYVKKYTVDTDHLKINVEGQDYEIYYAKADEGSDISKIYVPKNKEYEISGNNQDGFIITVKI